VNLILQTQRILDSCLFLCDLREFELNIGPLVHLSSSLSMLSTEQERRAGRAGSGQLNAG